MIDRFLWVPGGPLCEGDIEEVGGVLQVFCPWHDYDFDLRTGKSGTSLQVSDKTWSNVCVKKKNVCPKSEREPVQDSDLRWRSAGPPACGC